MGWREDISDRAQNGDVEGVLKIFDSLEEDRQRVRSLNEAYLKHIRELKGSGSKAPTPAKATTGGDALEACARARAAATDALKAATARLGAL